MVTGVQIHNWAEEFDSAEPNLEWVAPVNVYAVVDGKRYDINLSQLPVSQATCLRGFVSLSSKNCR